MSWNWFDRADRMYVDSSRIAFWSLGKNAKGKWLPQWRGRGSLNPSIVTVVATTILVYINQKECNEIGPCFMRAHTQALTQEMILHNVLLKHLFAFVHIYRYAGYSKLSYHLESKNVPLIHGSYPMVLGPFQDSSSCGAFYWSACCTLNPVLSTCHIYSGLMSCNSLAGLHHLVGCIQLYSVFHHGSSRSLVTLSMWLTLHSLEMVFPSQLDWNELE